MRLANDENTAYGLSVLVGLLLAILTIYLWFQVTRNEEAYIEEALNRQAADLSHVIEIELAKDIRGLRRMASRWEVRSDMPLSEWQADAQNYLQDVPLLERLILTNADFQLKWAEPASTSVAESSLQLLLTALQPSFYWNNGLGFATPSDTLNVRDKMIVAVQLETRHNTEGFLIGIYDLQQLPVVLREKAQSENFNVGIFAGPVPLFHSNETGRPVDTDRTVIQNLSMLNDHWKIHVVPTQDFLTSQKTTLPLLVFLTGLILSLITAITFFLGFTARLHSALVAETNTRLGVILNTTSEGFFGLDLNGHTTFANPAAGEMLGYKPEEMLNQPQHDLIHYHYADGAIYPREDCNIYAALHDGKTHTEDNEVFWRKDGTAVPVEYTSQPTLGPNGEITGAVVAFRDISWRKKEEEELKQKFVNRLTQSNTELERFAYVASHDMQEPIRMITSFSAIIAKDYANILDKTGQQYLKLIVDSGKRLKDLVEDLLEHSRVDNRGITKADFSGETALRGVLDNLSELIHERNAKITHDPLPILYGNPVQIMRLIQNLVGNAVKYQPDGRTPQVHISCESDNNNWHLSISDNGMGIKPEFINEIFQPFRRLHTWDKIAGTGLGLSICKKIVENHNGKIWVTSDYGQGSTFHFSLSKPPAAEVKTP